MRQSKPLSKSMKAPSYRVLLVMDTIGEHGPISLNALCKRLPDISRAGIWRAAAALRDYGWVRTRLSDNAFELTSKVDFRLANAHFAHEATQQAVDAIQKRLAQGATHVTAGVFVAPGQFEVVESTQAGVQIGVPLSLVFDEFAREAQCHMDQTALLTHLTAYLKRPDVPKEEVDCIQTGQHIKDLHALSKIEPPAGTWVHTKNTGFFLNSARISQAVLCRF